MAELEYSPILNGFVPLGTVATATETIDPTAFDALFVRETTVFTIPNGLHGESLTIGGGQPGAQPQVILGAGSVFTPDILVAAGGALQLGPDLPSADPANPAVLTGTLTVAPDATGVTITAGLLAGPVSAAGPIKVQGSASFIATLDFTGSPQLSALPGSQMTCTVSLTTRILQTILANPGFAGNLAFNGTLDNTGAQLDLSLASALSFVNAVVTGGTLLATPTSSLSGTTLDGVHLVGTLTTAAADFNVVSGTTTGGSINVDGSLGFADLAVIDSIDIALGAGALLYGVNASDITFAAGAAVHISDTATLAFASAGAHLQINGTLDLSASVSPYTVEIQANLGAVEFGAAAEISIGANATLKVNSALFNSGTIPVVGGTLELAHGGGSLGVLRFAGSDAALRLDTIGQTATLLDFQDGDHLVFPAASTSNAHVVLNGNTVDVFSGNNRLAGRFILSRSDGGSYATQDFTFGLAGSALSVATSGIAITACYAAGTGIETPLGNRAIETLRPGDHVRTVDGALQPIRWLGHRTLDLRKHPRPHDVQPVRIVAHAFGAGLPQRDLILSPDHAVHLEGALVPIRYLLNGATVIQEHRDSVSYWHLELASHNVVLAEGLAAETYLDTGNRAAFANGGESTALHPDFSRRKWHALGFAPLLTSGDTIALIRHTLLAQAETLGYRRTTDPDYRLVAGSREIRLASRISVPAFMDPFSDDYRSLGMAVTAIIADGKRLSLDDPRLTRGWYPPEDGLRWTDGLATIAMPPGTRLAIEHLAPGPRYWLAEAMEGARHPARA